MSGNPNGVHLTTSTDYDFNTSLPKSATDAGGLTTNIGYDAALNPSSASLPTGATAGAGYDYANLSSSSTVTYADGTDQWGTPITRTLTTSQVYDGWGRVIQSVDRNNGQVNTAYDNMGRVSSRTNPFTAGGAPGPATTIQYDITNKAVITTLPGGNTVRSDYSGATVTATDQVSRKIKRETDGLGRLIKVTEQDATGGLTQETSYSYNLLDKLTQVNQGGQLRSYKYDAVGRLLFEKIPEQSATINDGTGTYWSSAYAYIEFNSVKKKTEARGVESHYAFDALHRVTNIWFTGVGGDDSGAVRPALPSGVGATTDRNFTFTAWGALASVSIPNEYTESYAFDSFNRPASVTRWILGQTYDIRKTYTTSYQYNGGSQLSRLIYPSAQEVWIARDNNGRPSGLFPFDPNGQGTGYLQGVSYNPAGQVTALSLGNGVTQTFGYDANRLQLTTQVATKSGGPTGGLMNLAYGFNASAGQMGAGSTAGNAGQLMSITGTINSTTDSAAYTYDNLGRLLTSNQTSNASTAQRRFAYDRWGNRTGVWDAVTGGNQIQSIALQQSGGAPTNRITSVTSGSTVNYVYDAAGNVTNDGVHTYLYDAENRIVSVDGGATAQYRYDHQNRRVTKIIGSAWTHYIWQGYQVTGEHDGTTAYTTNRTYQVNSARVHYIFGGTKLIHSRQRTSSVAPWTTQYYLGDRLSTRLVLDGSGNVVGRQAHLPFGEDFAESGTQEKHHFTNYERDVESGTDYAVNRSNQPSTGRFHQVDKLSGKAQLPQSLNRYGYSWNDPINKNDPIGLDTEGGGGDIFYCGDPPGFGGVSFLLDGFSIPWEFCVAILVGAAVISVPQPKPPRLYAGFNDGDFLTIEAALSEALDLLKGTASGIDIDNDCATNLSARVFSGGRTINVQDLISKIGDLRIKSDTDNETVWGPFDLINGGPSRAPDIEHISGAGAYIDPAGRGIVILPCFFGGGPGKRIGFPQSRAVALIHELIHLQGIHDTDFDSDPKQGSRMLNTFIIQSCINKRLTHNDLSIVVK